MPHYYRLFGLSLASDLECPELLPAEPVSAPDLVFCYGVVPPALESAAYSTPRWQSAPGQYLANFDGLGRFHAHDGREITVQPAADASEEKIRTYLLSAFLSILLHQRRLFVLHCSGVATDRGAVIFAGKSGTGKSTMVSAMLDRGYKIVADDMLALTFDAQGRVLALPGFPQVKLWADSARALGRSTKGLRRVLPGEDKFIASERGRFSSTPVQLHAMYDLRIADVREPSLEPLAHTPRFHILLDHTWQKATLRGLGLREWHFQTAARIASSSYAARLVRPPEPLDIRRTVALVESDMQREHPMT